MHTDAIRRYLPELTERAQWVSYKFGKEKDNGKKDKYPKYVDSKGVLQNARTNDPSTWGTFNKVLSDIKKFQSAGLVGVGYVFSSDDPFVGIDLDNCRNHETGEIEQWAQDIIDKLRSYTEITPSNRGLHIICYGEIPRALKKDKLEIYSTGRFFTMTGELLHYDSLNKVIDCSEELIEIFNQYAPELNEPINHSSTGRPASATFLDDVLLASQCLKRLSKARCDDHYGWVRVGMSLYQLGQTGFDLWIEWSKQSTEFRYDDCVKRWRSFSEEGNTAGRLTLGSLVHWADEDDPAGKSPVYETEIEPFTPNPNASVGNELIEALSDDNPKFKKTWELTRKDFQENRQIHYDRSLVGFGVSNGLDNQIIADLIVSHRRKHNRNPEEVCQGNYLAKMIGWARNQEKATRVETKIDQQVQEAKAELAALIEHKEENGQVDRSELLTSLSKLFGVSIIRLTKCLSDPPEYILETSNGSIALGQINTILDQNAFRAKVAAVTNHVIPHFKKGWHLYVQQLLDAREEVDIGAEATDSGRAIAWITYYLCDRALIPDNQENLEDPFLKDGFVHIFGHQLRKWIFARYGEKVTDKEMGRCLHIIGCVPKQASRYVGSKRTTRQAWKIPHTVFSPETDQPSLIDNTNGEPYDNQQLT